MLKLLIFKISLLFTICCITSCGFLSPESANEFTVTKKSPLLIPPDMNIIPPGKRREKAETAPRKTSIITDDFSLEEILTGEAKAKKTYIKKKKIKSSKKKNLVRSILKMNELVTLE